MKENYNLLEATKKLLWVIKECEVFANRNMSPSLPYNKFYINPKDIFLNQERVIGLMDDDTKERLGLPITLEEIEQCFDALSSYYVLGKKTENGREYFDYFFIHKYNKAIRTALSKQSLGPIEDLASVGFDTACYPRF